MKKGKVEPVKKGKNIVTFTIGIISFILAFIIFMQFKFVQSTDITSIKNMRQEELRAELVLWKGRQKEVDTQLDEVKEKLEEYEKNIEDDAEVGKLINEELAQNKLLLGETDVKGPGVLIYYEDGEKAVTVPDLLSLVNELYIAEAEAISINNQRIVNSTEIVLAESHIYVNGERVNSPYVVKAIGNRKYMEGSLTLKNGLADTAPKEGKKFSVEGKDNIQIPKYNKKQNAEHINLK